MSNLKNVTVSVDVKSLLFSLALVVAFSSHTQAQSSNSNGPSADVRRAPLPRLSRADLETLAPLLEDHTIALVELSAGQRLPGMVLATHIEAAADDVARVISEVSRWPTFMPGIHRVTVDERHGHSQAFSWQWQASLFNLAGRASMNTLLAPPEARQRGHRITLERTEGDLGTGRDVWRILPRGENRSLLLFSTRIDIRNANYLTRQISAGARSINRSVNLALAYGMVLRTRGEAERRTGHPPTRRPSRLARPALPLPTLEPLLSRGDLVAIRSAGTDVQQASVFTRIPQSEARVRRVMLDPVAFTEALIAGSEAIIRERRPESTDFEWRVNLPIVGTSGGMRLRQVEPEIHLDATDGAMAGGRWRFVTERLPSGATGVVGWATFDVTDANFILRAIVDADPAFRPGLSAATEIMMARALRIRAARPL